MKQMSISVHTLRVVKRISIALIILLGVVVGIARLSLPLLENRHADIQALAAEVLRADVTIDEVDTRWSGLHPVIMMQGVHINDKHSAADSPNITLEELEVSIDVIGSLTQMKIRPGAVWLHISNLEVSREENGQFTFDLGRFLDSNKPDSGVFEIRHLLQQPDVRVIADQVLFTDRQKKIPDLCVNSVDMIFRHDADDLVAQIHADVCHMAKSIQLTSRFRLDSLQYNILAGQVYMQLQQVSLDFWQKSIQHEISLPDKGVVDVTAWLTVSDNQFSALQGAVDLRDIAYTKTATQAAFSLEHMSANFFLEHSDDSWELQLSDWQLRRNGVSRPASDVQVKYLTQKKQLTLSSRYLTLGDILPVVIRQPQVQSVLPVDVLSLSPDGILEDIHVQLALPAQAEDSMQYALQANFRDIAINAAGDWPEVRGIDGYVAATTKGGLLKLNTENASVDLHTLFRDPLQLKQLQGDLSWSVLGSGVLIESAELLANNAHVSTTSRLSIHVPEDGSPFIDMQTNFKDGNGAYTSLYLPSKIMPQEAVEWLDNSIVSGDVEQGTFVLHGKADDYPFDNQEGQFEVRFNVRNGILAYYEDWPRLEDIEAEVVFQGRSMLINATQGKIFDSDIQQTRVAIADLWLDNPILEVTGSSRTQSDDLLRYLGETDLAGDYQQALSVFKLQGEHHLNLHLTIPLDVGDVTFNGDVDFRGNHLAIDRYGVQIQDIEGLLKFSEKGFVAKDISARFDGRPLHADVKTGGSGTGRETSIRIKTKADVASVLKAQNIHIPENIAGITDVSIRIDVPDVAGVPSRFHLHSNLRGVHLDFPEPFSKPAGASWPLVFKTGFSGEAAKQIEIDLDERLSSVLTLNDGGELQGAFIGVDTTPPDKSVVREGIQVQGRLSDVDSQAWLMFFSTFSTRGASTSTLNLPMDINFQLEKLFYKDQYMEDVTLKAKPSAKGWSVKLKGDIDGELEYSRRHGLAHLSIDAKNINIKKRQEDNAVQGADMEASDTVVPNDLPTLDIQVDQMHYQGREIGSLDIVTERKDNNLLLTKAVLKNSDAEIKASGGWYLRDKNHHQTQLNIDLSSDDFGGVMHRLGFDDTVDKGQAKILVEGMADKSPASIGVSDWQGTLDMTIHKGKILEIDPGGAGRIFGLLSFHTLPRRLALDFTDLYSKGMSFDEISGQFSISDGQAYTNNLVMDSPSSQVEISGRVGLKDEDYDQMVKVTPNISSSLPVAGALAGGPGLAVVMFFTHQFLEKPINKITELEYEVTGSWSDPQIKVAKLETADKDGEIESNQADIPQDDDSL